MSDIERQVPDSEFPGQLPSATVPPLNLELFSTWQAFAPQNTHSKSVDEFLLFMISTLCFSLEAIHTVSKASKSFEKPKSNTHSAKLCKVFRAPVPPAPQKWRKNRAEHRAELAFRGVATSHTRSPTQKPTFNVTSSLDFFFVW